MRTKNLPVVFAFTLLVIVLLCAQRFNARQAYSQPNNISEAIPTDSLKPNSKAISTTYKKPEEQKQKFEVLFFYDVLENYFKPSETETEERPSKALICIELLHSLAKYFKF